jgi:hypothetical protein
LGAWLGGWCFILPNFVIVAALGALYVYLGDLQPVTAIFYGVSPAVIALILHSCYRLAKLGMEDRVQWAIAGVCLVVTVILQAEVALLFIGAGIVGILCYGSIFKRTPVSHIHPDHIGNVDTFPDATLIMQRHEWEAAMASPQKPFSPEHKTELLDGDKDLFGDGSLTILSTPGHTAGHQSLLVHLNKTGYVLSNRIIPIRASIVGPLRSATSNNACTAACHSSASCSALGSFVM